MTKQVERPLVESVPDGRVGGEHEDDDVVHSWCCDENRSWCGLDMTDHPEVEQLDNCPLCELAREDLCPRCGQ